MRTSARTSPTPRRPGATWSPPRSGWASRCPASPPPWPTTMRCGPNACPPPWSRACATSSARTRTAVRTATARSIRCGPTTVRNNPASDLWPERAGFLPRRRSAAVPYDADRLAERQQFVRGEPGPARGADHHLGLHRAGALRDPDGDRDGLSLRGDRRLDHAGPVGAGRHADRRRAGALDGDVRVPALDMQRGAVDLAGR